jgi:uncharacterized membrane protein YkgB
MENELNETETEVKPEEKEVKVTHDIGDNLGCLLIIIALVVLNWVCRH